jgi:transposase
VPAPFSRDLRIRIMAAITDGATTSAIAARFGVSHRTVRRYRQQIRDTGTIEPRPNRGRRAQLVIDAERLIEQLSEQPTATLADHCRAWTARTGQTVSVTTMWRAVRTVGWTRKKGQWQPGNGTRPPELPGARQ